MKKTDLLIGFLIGILTTLIGTLLFLSFFTKFNSFDDFAIINESGVLGKVMAIGGVLNLFAFFGLLQSKKELMARGVILATIVLAIATIFI